MADQHERYAHLYDEHEGSLARARTPSKKWLDAQVFVFLCVGLSLRLSARASDDKTACIHLPISANATECIYLPICLSPRLPARVSGRQTDFLYLCTDRCVQDRQTNTVCLFVCPACPSIYPTIDLSVCLSFRPFPSSFNMSCLLASCHSRSRVRRC